MGECDLKSLTFGVLSVTTSSFRIRSFSAIIQIQSQACADSPIPQSCTPSIDPLTHVSIQPPSTQRLTPVTARFSSKKGARINHIVDRHQLAQRDADSILIEHLLGLGRPVRAVPHDPGMDRIHAQRSISEIDAPPVSKELKKRWSYFIRKVYETDPLICPECQGEMWFDKLTTLRKLEGRIISFIDQPGVIKKFFNTLAYGKSPTRLLKETLQ